MFSIPSLYELGTCSDSYDILHGMSNTLPSSSDDLENQNLCPRSMAEAKAVAASNSHKEAERRRRKRINGHISTLKSILPITTKTDKASLLSEAVRRVKELKKTALELENNDQSNNTLKLMLPSETDELKLNRCEDDSGLIKASLCCEDRPEMILDLIRALDSVQAKVVRAEMSTLGGRTKSVLWVKINNNNNNNNNNNDYKNNNNNNDNNVEGESDVCLGTLRRALKTVIDKSTFLAGNNQCLPGNKRQRYYHLC